MKKTLAALVFGLIANVAYGEADQPKEFPFATCKNGNFVYLAYEGGDLAISPEKDSSVVHMVESAEYTTETDLDVQAIRYDESTRLFKESIHIDLVEKTISFYEWKKKPYYTGKGCKFNTTLLERFIDIASEG